MGESVWWVCVRGCEECERVSVWECGVWVCGESVEGGVWACLTLYDEAAWTCSFRQVRIQAMSGPKMCVLQPDSMRNLSTITEEHSLISDTQYKANKSL